MIFVTGGTGMLGAHLLYYLSNKNEKIIAIKRKESSLAVVHSVFSALSENSDELLKRIDWKIADINDFISLKEVMNSCEYVYHLAAVVSFAPRDREAMIESNIQGTSNVINAALENGVKKICHVSSISALGEGIDNKHVDEGNKRNLSLKHSNYSESKYRSELVVWRAINEGLDAIIVNPSIILGIGDWSKLGAAMFTKVNEGFKFYSKGGSGFVDARDVCKCMIELTESEIKNERFVINSENLKFKEVFGLIAENLQKPKANIYANSFLRGLAWRVDTLKSFIFKTKPVLTKETAKSANEIKTYSNKKIKEAIRVDFIKIKDTIRFMSHFFTKNKKI